MAVVAVDLSGLQAALKHAGANPEDHDLVILNAGTYSLSTLTSPKEIVVPAGVRLQMGGFVTVTIDNPTRGFLLVGSGPLDRGDGAFLDLRGLRLILDMNGKSQRPNFAWKAADPAFTDWVANVWNPGRPPAEILSVDTDFKKTWGTKFPRSPVVGIGNSTAPNRNSMVTVADSDNVTILGGYGENLNCGIALVGRSDSNRINNRNNLLDGPEFNLTDTGILVAHQDNCRVNGLYCHDGTMTQTGEPHALYATGEPTADEINRSLLLTNTRLERMQNGEPIKLKTCTGAIIDNVQLIDCSAFLLMGTSDAVVSNITMANQRILYVRPGNRQGGSGNSMVRVTNGGALQVNNYRLVQQPTPIDSVVGDSLPQLTGRPVVPVSGTVQSPTTPWLGMGVVSVAAGFATSNWIQGLPVTGTGITGGTVLTNLSFDAASSTWAFVLSNPPSAAIGDTVTLHSPSIVRILTNPPSYPPLKGWFPGLGVASSGSLPTGTSVVSIPYFAVKTKGSTTQHSTSITGLADTSTIIVGAPISGTGIPAGAVVTAVIASTITISAQATITSPALMPTVLTIDGNGSDGVSVSGSTLTFLSGDTATIRVGMCPSTIRTTGARRRRERLPATGAVSIGTAFSGD